MAGVHQLLDGDLDPALAHRLVAGVVVVALEAVAPLAVGILHLQEDVPVEVGQAVDFRVGVGHLDHLHAVHLIRLVVDGREAGVLAEGRGVDDGRLGIEPVDAAVLRGQKAVPLEVFRRLEACLVLRLITRITVGILSSGQEIFRNLILKFTK